MLPKLTKKQKYGIVGFSALIVGLYMIFILNNIRGIIPGLFGLVFLFLMKNAKRK